MAIKLLELEPNIKKKVPILLWMESYEKAIIDSVIKILLDKFKRF